MRKGEGHKAMNQTAAPNEYFPAKNTRVVHNEHDDE